MTPASPDLIDSRYAAWRLLTTVLLVTLGNSSMYVVAVVLPAVQQEFGVSRADASLPYTLMMICLGVGGVLTGKLADRHGITPVLWMGAVAVCAGFVCAGMSPNIWTFGLAHGVLLGQIVLYLPYFVVCWGWFFHRLDWVGRGQPGQILQLTDLSPTHELGRFDYFHSAINTLLNKSKPTIAGVSRRGRIAVLIFNGMVLGLYTVAFTRILQLTKVVL